MAHISGLVAVRLAESPFPYADVVTTTTHKTLRGPRAGMIFSKAELASRIDFGVFPMLQGGPHNHQIAALAAQLHQAGTFKFHSYTHQVLTNARRLAEILQKKGYKIMTGGTDNHMILMSSIDKGLTGSKLEAACDAVHITLNKNTIVGDRSALTPGGVRIGTPAITTRGYIETDMDDVADYVDAAFQIALGI